MTYMVHVEAEYDGVWESVGVEFRSTAKGVLSGVDAAELAEVRAEFASEGTRTRKVLTAR